MANSGPYTHPSFLTRQILAFRTVAGASGTSSSFILPWDINVHQVCAVVATAGTAAGNAVFLLSGTSSVASSQITLGTATAGSTGTTGDLATKIPASTLISIKNGTDAVGVANVTVEYNLAPASATWLGNE